VEEGGETQTVLLMPGFSFLLRHFLKHIRNDLSGVWLHILLVKRFLANRARKQIALTILNPVA